MLPLDDRRFERFNADLAGRPQLDPRQLAAPVRRHGPAVRELRRRHQEQVARGHGPDRRARTAARNGVIIAQGGAFGGWSLYAKDGKPAYCYNLFGLQQFKVYGDDADPGGRAPGADGVRLRRRRARQGRRRRRSTSTAQQVGEGRVDGDGADALLGRRDDRRRQRHRARRSATTTARRTASSPGTVRWVQIDIDEAAEDLDHLISPEERLRVAMARQQSRAPATSCESSPH